MGGRLAAGQVTDEESLVDEPDVLRLDALVVVAEAAETAGNRGVRHDGDLVAAVAQLSEQIWGHEAGAGICGLGSVDAVELGGVAAGLMNLERQLRGIEDDGLATRRAVLGAKEGAGLLGHPRCVGGELHRLHQLPAALAHFAAEGVGIAALLQLVLADGAAFDPSPGFEGLLFDLGSLGGDEYLAPVGALRRGLGDTDLRLGAEQAFGLDQESHLVLEADREGIDLDRPFELSLVGRRRPKFNRAPMDGGAGPGNAQGDADGFVDVAFAHRRGGGEAPCPIDQHAHAQAFGKILDQAVDTPVLDRDLLVPGLLHPGVRILGSSDAGRVERAQSLFLHATSPLSASSSASSIHHGMLHQPPSRLRSRAATCPSVMIWTL